uniref:Uncharacterized protein n=1 Tax=Helianthus annuus TaxID=4232 RepID=A0A251RLT0_HELAN
MLYFQIMFVLHYHLLGVVATTTKELVSFQNRKIKLSPETSTRRRKPFPPKFSS